MGLVDVSDLDAAACADALASSQSQLVEAERLQVELVAQWCDVHSARPPGPGPVRPGAERSVVIAGDGTPAVREFAAAELGLLIGMTSAGAGGLMRDVLGLRHRHPRLFSLVRAGHARLFQARQVARIARAADLDLAQARQVDERVAPYIGQVSWGRIMGLVEAAVIEADPEAAEQRRVAAEMQRFVRTGRSSEFGTSMIYARARAGDAIFFLAMCDRIAQILRLRGSLEVAGHADHHPDHPDGSAGPDAAREMDVLRSEAVGILASPVKALALLQWAETRAAEADETAGTSDEPHQSEPAEPELPNAPGSTPAVVLDGSLDPGAFSGRAVLYVHVSQESFRGRTRGAARVEGVGPVTLEQAVDFLRHCRVTVRPVIDLEADPSADGYEVSPLVRETVVLRDPVEPFPWGTQPSRSTDADHRIPFAHPTTAGADPPDPQTHADNLQPLGRLHHRLKTHGGWACTSPERGVQLWRSPHGHWARVDAGGTTYIGRLEGAPVVTEVLHGHLGLLSG